MTPDLQDVANSPSVTQDENGNVQYCPGCGRRVRRPQECKGTATAPHPGIETVPIAEILNAPDPDDRAATVAWQSHHTEAPGSA